MLDSLRIFPLGGLGEIGMNCLALEQGGEILIVDCGVTFDDRKIGVDVIHPDFSALEPYRDRIAGVFVTHGHEDHIGALPYFLRRFDVPIWSPPYALGLLRERLAEHEILEHTKFVATHPRNTYQVGSFAVEPIRVTHSIADATALAIRTRAGTVIHTGDFKFDEDPPDGEMFDEARLRELGESEEGVALLLSDSTNIDAEGTSGGERSVGDALLPLVASAKGAVVVALFASNVHRLRLMGEIAKATGRVIVPLGRSIVTHSRVATATGYLDWPSDLVYSKERARELPREKVLGLATGTQAEARAALARLAAGDHPHFALNEGDTVILSSRIIPGHEPEVFALMSAFLRRGIDVRTRTSDRGIHVSGHAHRSEQRRMLSLVKPRSFMPLHGTLHHLMRHAELAREEGVARTMVMENGDVIELTRHGADASLEKKGRVETGRVHTFAGRSISRLVLRDRQALAAEGIAIVYVTVDAHGFPRGEVAITTRGVIDEALEPHLLAMARNDARTAIEEMATTTQPAGGRSKESAATERDARIAEGVRVAVRRSFGRNVGFKPMTVVQVLRSGDSP